MLGSFVPVFLPGCRWTSTQWRMRMRSLARCMHARSPVGCWASPGDATRAILKHLTVGGRRSLIKQGVGQAPRTLKRKWAPCCGKRHSVDSPDNKRCWYCTGQSVKSLQKISVCTHSLTNYYRMHILVVEIAGGICRMPTLRLRVRGPRFASSKCMRGGSAPSRRHKSTRPTTGTCGGQER